MINRARRLATAIAAVVVAMTGIVVGTATQAAAAGPAQLPLVTFFNAGTGDYFTTSQPQWTCQYFDTCADHPDYVAVGRQGDVFNPDNPQPAGTVKLFHWWSPDRGDNFLTTDPNWAGNVGDRRVSGSEYTLFRIEGFVNPAPASAGPLTLRSFWSGANLDNAAIVRFPNSTTPAGYSWYRNEADLIRPVSAGLTGCQTNAAPRHTLTSWHAAANTFSTYGSPFGLRRGDALHLSATGFTRIDGWGTTVPVIGLSGHRAGDGFPLPSEPPYTLIGKVTAGGAFVQGRWFEANTWFPVVGHRLSNGTITSGPCVFVDPAVGGQFQVGINDPTLWDNGGYADVTARQWF
ncbi:hypothetical protein [Actinokineospora sp. HUAS TT18]|uniref:hypothetical protein n=1 Tax=Actinokineospora sp. HUAS TT18 TaxID=3447451 RepID=UPI003F524043